MITAYLEQNETISTSKAHALYTEKEGNIPRTTVNWRLHELVKEGLIERTGRGVFRLPQKNTLTIDLPKELKDIAVFLNKNYPLVSWCVWSFDFLKTLTQHIPSDQVLFVDVEKDSQEAILFALGDTFDNVYEEKVYATIKKSLPNGIKPVIVRTLISEAPIEEVEAVKIPTLEKMLVDFAVDDFFSFLEGQEIQHVFANACERYRIHTNRLFRYASRRGRKEQIEKLYTDTVQQESGND